MPGGSSLSLGRVHWRRKFALCLMLLLVLGEGCRRSSTTDSQTNRHESRGEAPALSSERESDEVRPPSPLPEGFPADVPVYPGAIVLVSRRTETQLTATFATSDGLSQVLDFYRAQLPRAGWTVQEREQTEGIAFEGRKGTRACQVALTEDHARTYIAFVLSLAPKAGMKE
ncbi:MAG: hypothetical protein N0A16_01475 [Blastocatellia bacterium]|nr:hypothetical protein [Blastocatellia bacterium]